MTWYFWVWGVTSCVALLALIILCAVGIAYLLEHRRARVQVNELSSINAALERRIENLKMKLDFKQRELAEVRKEQNEFGKISP